MLAFIDTFSVSNLTRLYLKGISNQVPVIKQTSHWDVMYTMVTTVNNTVLHIWKLLREEIFFLF